MKVFHNPDPNVGYFYILRESKDYFLCLNFIWAMARNGSFGPEIMPKLMSKQLVADMFKQESELEERTDICHGWITSLFKQPFIDEYNSIVRMMR